jgi:hypothetical protein
MIRHNQLSDRQKNSLSQPPQSYTADPVPNSEKLEVNGDSGELLRKARLASRVLLQNSVRLDLFGGSGPKLVPFVLRTSARKPASLAREVDPTEAG